MKMHNGIGLAVRRKMSLGMIRAVTYSLFSTEGCRQKLLKKGVVQDLIWTSLPHLMQFSLGRDHLMG
jgi:hypothetical protein